MTTQISLRAGVPALFLTHSLLLALNHRLIHSLLHPTHHHSVMNPTRKKHNSPMDFNHALTHTSQRLI